MITVNDGLSIAASIYPNKRILGYGIRNNELRVSIHANVLPKEEVGNEIVILVINMNDGSIINYDAASGNEDTLIGVLCFLGEEKEADEYLKNWVSLID